CVFIPAGTVHALGEGLLVAEIQQASDCTFRLFDWNRVDRDGKPRELHVDQALDVIDFARGPVEFVPRSEPDATCPRVLVDCDKFVLAQYQLPGIYPLQSPQIVILTTPKGTASVACGDRKYAMDRGQTLLIPFGCESPELHVGENSIVLASTLPQVS
ncbi:MAG: class I mannose-6-phosphate isomerase, partial [Pirellula sp.]